MLPFPDEIVLYVLSFVDDLLDVSRATKTSRRFAQRSLRHPVVAARRGDRFSLGWVVARYVPELPSRDPEAPHNYLDYKILTDVRSILVQHGHVRLAVKFSRPTKLLHPRPDDVLMNGTEDMIFGTILTVMQLSDPEAATKVRYAIGKLGPASAAYRTFTSMHEADYDVLTGLCRGGHLDEAKKHPWPNGHVPRRLAYKNRLVYKSIKSGNRELALYAMDKNDEPLDPVRCVVAAFDSRDLKMAKLVMAVMLRLPAIFGLSDAAGVMEVVSSVLVPSTKEIHEYLETLGISLKPNEPHYFADEGYLAFLHDRDPKRYNLEVANACRRGFLRLAAVLISEGKKCDFCEGKFHA